MKHYRYFIALILVCISVSATIAQENLVLSLSQDIKTLPAWQDENIVSVGVEMERIILTNDPIDVRNANADIHALLMYNPGSFAVDVFIDDKMVKTIPAGGRSYLELPSTLEFVLNIEGSKNQSVHIQRCYVKKNSGDVSRNFGFGADLPCEIDVHCPEGLPYSMESKSIVRIFMLLEQGIGYCSGSFVNNTAQDKTPYILSAFHCIDGYTPIWDSWEFDIGFESYLCGGISHDPGDYTFEGCSYVAGDQTFDFMLLKLDEGVGDLPVSFLGWNRVGDYRPDTAVLIHHPQGDLKKVSLNTDGLTTNPNQIFWSNDVVSPPNSHLMCDLDIGTYEGGSSGAPLLDTEGHILGQLHGGRASCVEFLTFAGRFSRSWDGATPDARLKDWLDPLNTGVSELDPLNQGPVGEWITASGRTMNAAGEGIANAIVAIDGTTMRDTTSASGAFNFSYFHNGQAANVLALKVDNHLNGVNVLDVVKLRKYLLGFEQYNDQYEFIASDVTGDGQINVLDFVAIRKLILGFISVFNIDPPWFFISENGTIELDNPDQLILRGHKIGDLDNSANPQN